MDKSIATNFILVLSIYFLWIGTSRASVLENTTDIAKLKLTSMCSDEPSETRRWRVRNPNDFEVEVYWKVYGTSQSDTILVPSGDSFFETKTVGGANTTIIKWQDGSGKWKQTVKASGGQKCVAQDLNNIFISSDSIIETLPIGALVAAFSMKIGDISDYTFQLEDSVYDNSFFIVEDNYLKSVKEFSFKKDSAHQIRIKAIRKSDNKVYHKDFVLRVVFVPNEISNIQLSNNSIKELSEPNSFIGYLTAEELKNEKITFLLASDNGLFDIKGNSLVSTAPFFYTTQPKHTIEIVALAESSDTVRKQFDILIENVINSPENIVLSSTTVDEFQPSGTVVGELIAIDIDSLDLHQFEIIGGTEEFSIEGNNLLTGRSFNYREENPRNIKIRVADQDSAFFEKAFSIYINDLSDAPTDITLSNNEINEGLPIGTFIGELASQDADSLDIHQYYLVEGNGADNNIDFYIEDNGLYTQFLPDFNEQNIFKIRIESRDLRGDRFKKNFEINILNQINAPTDISLELFQPVYETAGERSSLGVFVASDIDVNAAHSFELVANEKDNYAFELHDDTLINIVTFEYAVQHEFLLEVKVTDEDGEVYQKSVPFSIEKINDGGSGEYVTGGGMDETNSINVEMADLDGDGDLDVIVGNKVQSSEVYLNDGEGRLEKTAQEFEPSNLYGMRLADFNNDGFKDVVFANWGSGHTIWFNNGSGEFTKSTQVIDRSYALTIVPIDIEGDGDQDLIVANYTEGNEIWLNNGEGLFSFDRQISATLTYNLMEADLDNDGDLDLMELVYGGNNKVWLNDGLGNFVMKEVIETGINAYDGDLGDLDNDGDLDLVLANPTEGNAIFLNDGTGSFTDSGLSLGKNATYSVSVGDIDNDNDLDLFFANRFAPVTVWENDGKGNFNKTDQQIGNADSRKIGLGKLDPDNDLDAFIANSGAANTIWLNNSIPTGIQYSSLSVVENSPLNSFVSTLTGIDADVWDSLAISFADGLGGEDNSFFEIREDSLILKKNVDYETTSALQIRVRITDKAGAFTEKSSIIKVIDLDETPYFSGISKKTVSYGSGTLVTELEGIINPSGKPLTFEIDASDESLLKSVWIDYVEGAKNAKIGIVPFGGEFGSSLIKVTTKTEDGAYQFSRQFVYEVLPPKITTTNAASCGASELTLMASGGINYFWYPSGTSLQKMFEGDAYTKVFSETTTYFVSVVSPSGSESDDRVEVSAEIYPVPEVVICQKDSLFTVDDRFTAYQWYKNGEQIVDANEFSIVSNKSGIYKVEVLTIEGCSIFSQPISYETSLVESDSANTSNSFGELESQNTIADTNSATDQITIYPNPSSDWLNINFTEKLTNPVLRVYNSSGFQVLEVFPESDDVSLNLSSLNSGLYFLEVISEKGKSKIRFIKK